MVASAEVQRIARIQSLRKEDALLLPQIEEVLVNAESGRIEHCVPTYIQKCDIKEILALLLGADRVSASLVESNSPNLRIKREILSRVAELAILRSVADNCVLLCCQWTLNSIHHPANLVSCGTEWD